MTWEEWLASDYNTDGLFYFGTVNGIINTSYSRMICGEKPSNTIKTGVTYTFGEISSFMIKHGGADGMQTEMEFYATGET